MKKSKTIILIMSMGGILTLLIVASSTLAAEYSGQELMEKSSECLNCHEEMALSLAGSAHQVITAKSMKSSIPVGCIGCHEGWDKHILEPSSDNILNLPDQTPAKQSEICRQCHADPHQAGMSAADPHARAQLGCLSCHKIHDNKSRFLVKDDDENYCRTCHTSVAAEFKLRSAHPLESGNIRCTGCHKLSDLKDPSLKVGHNWTCQSCHTDQSGPFPYEHPAVYDHLTQGGGCTECHEPHGSPNDRLLSQPGNGLCLKCHGIPAGHRTRHSGLGSKLDCVFCHRDIHGSFDNNKFLDPDLGTKLFPDCYQSGCHIFNN